MRYCLLCGKKSKDVTYFKFPSDGHLKKKWLQFCGVPEKNLKVSHRLCSDHFFGEDLIWRAGRVYIKHTGVIPGKYNPENVEMLITSKNCIQNNNEDQMEISSDTLPAEIIASNESLDVTAAIANPYTSPSAARNFTVKRKAVNLTDESSVLSTSCAAKSPKMTNPRYIGDITSENWKTPRRAAIAFSVIKRNIRQQTVQIQSLKRFIKRYKERISLLKDIVKNLKKQQLISDNGAKFLLMYLNRLL